ncbi:MAG: hypothetical protein V3S18_02115, partial [Dehalococcoidia bacterium]
MKTRRKIGLGAVLLLAATTLVLSLACEGGEGASGAKGDSGPGGSQGIAGATGDAGPAGDAGATGLAGATGDTGSAGATGDAGSAGAEGDTGPAGARGATGAAGAQGPAGLMGTEVASVSFAAPAQAPAMQLASTGHWHLTRAKTLSFTISDAAGQPLTGLKPTVTVKTHAGSVDVLSAEAGQVVDNGDGTYSAEYTANDLGSGYASAYSIALATEVDGVKYFDAWPVEVVRDGNEGITPTIGGTMYAYQARYAWVPGIPEPGGEVTMYFEPRRAVQTGDDLNTAQPWSNTFNNLPDLQDLSVLVESAEGALLETITPT